MLKAIMLLVAKHVKRLATVDFDAFDFNTMPPCINSYFTDRVLLMDAPN